MSVSGVLGMMFESGQEGRNIVRALWDRLASVPGGSWIFSKAIGTFIRYTGTVRAHVVELRAGHARVEMADRPAVRNHLQSVHAVALANLAELTGNIALSYSMPDDARFIVTGLAMRYHKKARGTITGVCESPVPPTSERAEYEFEVLLKDADGVIVATASLATLVGPNK